MEFSDRSIAIKSNAIIRSGAAERPRILMVNSGFRSDAESAKRAEALSAALTGDGWVTGVECCSDSSGISVTEESDLRRLLSLAMAFRKLARMIPHFQVIHVAAGNRISFLMFALPALFLARFLGKKTVLSFYLADAKEFFRRWARLVCPLLKMADRLIVDSSYMAMVLRENRLDPVIFSIPLPAQQQEFRPPSRLQPRILVDRPLEPSFNIGSLIRAFRFIKQKYPRAELVVTGTGSQRPTLEELVRTEAIHGVFFSGDLNGPAVESDSAGYDLYVVPSGVDSSPLTVLRSFTAGLPVVATNVGGIADLVKDRVNGLIVPVGNHVALAERIFELIENPELVAKLTHQAKIDSEAYKWESLGAGWRRVYRDVVSK